MTEQEFRLQADRALEGVQQALLPLADQEGFEVELQNGVLQVDLRGSISRKIRRQSKRAGPSGLAVRDVTQLQARVVG